MIYEAERCQVKRKRKVFDFPRGLFEQILQAVEALTLSFERFREIE
jgi:hypothetical protein